MSTGQQRQSETTGVRAALLAVAVGILHAALFVILVVGLKDPAGLGATYIAPELVQNWLWCLLGLVLLAAVPVYIWLTRGLVAPTLAFLVLLALATYGEWQFGHEAAGSTWGPAGTYMSAWPAPLLVILLVAGVELLVRRATVSETSI